MEIETTKLRNGTYEADVAIRSVTFILSGLWKKGMDGIFLIHDLREICRGNSSEVSPEALTTLKKLKLVMDNGRVHSTVKNILDCSLKGESYNITLVSPLG